MLLVVATSAGAQDAPSLFAPAQARSPAPDPPREEIRSRRVELTLALLGGAGAGALDDRAPTRVTFDLFDDVAVELELIERAPLKRGGYSWRGRPVDGSLGEASLIVRNGRVWGNLRVRGGLFQIRPEGDAHRVREVDPALLDEGPDDAEPPPGSFALLPPAGLVAAPATIGNPVIDVLVVYSSAARIAAGGAEGIAALIELGELETNTSYANSDVAQRIRVVHTEEVAYTETGDAQLDRDRLRLTADGYLDEVHALRDVWGADAVSLWLSNSGCGIAYIMSPVSPGFAPFAFSTCALACCTGNLTFGHELGHNMSARHDWFVDPTANSPYSFNHGYTHIGATAAQSFRTVMGYADQCLAVFGQGCPRLQHFSNPAVSVAGAATGVAAGTSTACTALDTENPPCDADNQSTLDGTAATFAAFRATQVFVTLVKEVDAAGAVTGDTLTYTLTATNTSQTTATGVVLTDTVPDPTELDLSSLSGDASAGGIVAGSTITWTTGESLAPGASLVRSFAVTALAPGLVTNTAAVAVDETTLAVSSNPTTTRVAGSAECGFADGFEGGALGFEWLPESTLQGRAAVGPAFPRSGVLGLILDDAVPDGTFSEAGVVLRANLAGASGVTLSFWWADGADEYDAAFDGVFLRESDAEPWTKVYDFTGPADYTWQEATLDLDVLAGANELTLGDAFQIRFGFRDNFAFLAGAPDSSDGYAIDDVELGCALSPCDEVLEGETVSGAVTVETACRIFAGPSFTVESGGDLTLRADQGVVLRAGFSVTSGGGLAVGSWSQ
jgi:uncharacterized repeat protein (TIGR01451 family)